jgi:hypothetical protein
MADLAGLLVATAVQAAALDLAATPLEAIAT